tara:strand:- start:2584 stop:3021 length:438 start_codon:yes stop_codon:yes gene_type:complete
MLLSPEIWVPHLQFLLQTISIMYPMNPNDVSKKKYYDMINNLPVFFPENPMGKYFTKLLDQYPLTPYLKSRESFMRWVHFINNKINVFMNREQETFYDSLENYYKAYKPHEIIKQENSKKKKKYIEISIIIATIAFIIYLLKKKE